jgi:chorismate dehydratase
MRTQAPPLPVRPSRSTLRVGSVSFLNAKPLIYGLDSNDNLELELDVPSKLLDGLVEERYDVALLPVIDYQRLPGLRLLTAGGIGCDGPTLTVRIFSRVPIDEVQTLACDTDSHTSVALAQILLADHYGLSPRFVDLDEADDAPGTARLLIGDKVVCEEPPSFPHQLDLGGAWKAMTGLPFVFAAWMARDGVDLGDLPEMLDRARVLGLRHVDQIVAEHAVPRGWPGDVARRYLAEHLKFEIGPRQLDAIREFHGRAARHGIIPTPPRGLVVVPPSAPTHGH